MAELWFLLSDFAFARSVRVSANDGATNAAAPAK
jgi:hypothetical protein